MTMKLENKVAVISGGTNGIGLAIAQRFVREGAEVFIFPRRQEVLDEAVKLIGGKVTTIQANAAKVIRCKPSSVIYQIGELYTERKLSGNNVHSF